MNKHGMFLATVVGVALAVSAASALAGSPPELVTLCHKGKQTLILPKPAAQAHITQHGDTLGPCGCGPCISDAECPEGMICDTEDCLVSCVCPACDVCAGFCVPVPPQ